MTQRIKSLLITLASFTTVISVLSGCATVTTDSDLASQQTSQNTYQSLRISDAERTDNSRPAGQASLRKPQSKLQSPGTASLYSSNSGLPSIEISTPQEAPLPIDLTSETEDLFQRMRNGFSMPDINNDLVLYHQQWYMNHPDYLRRIVERSSLYIHYIIEELTKRGMPSELALLPMVESAYNPMAYSRAKASGLWQFIPSTGKHFNLDQNWWKDERRDVVASTTAALDYLQLIYEMHGDWHLALASYNWGEGSVGRAVNKNRALGLPEDYLSLNMPGETKNYVPKLQALKNIFSNPALLTELNLTKIPNRPYFGTVTRATNIDVKVAAKLAGMQVQEFVALNPAHNRPVIKSETPMVIPADKIDTFVSNLEEHETSNIPLSSWQSYTVRPGDKLDKIASRFGMTVAKLKQINGIEGRMKITPGITLLVAAEQEGGQPPDMASLPEQPKLPATDPTPTPENRSHKIRKGETLPVIAKRYGTSVAELKRINHLRSDKIAAGDNLLLPTAVKTAKSNDTNSGKKATQPTPQAKADKKSPKTTQYTIRRGDTLSSIAKHFKVGKDDLLRWNRISEKKLIPGKTLIIQTEQTS